MTKEFDHGEPRPGEQLESLGTFQTNGKSLHVSRWKWHGSRGEQILFSENESYVPKGTWRGARVMYRKIGSNDIVFSGISVSSDLRGGGGDFFDFFLKDSSKRGKKVIGTDVIRKPLMAQMLMRAGWKPETRTHTVEVLPLSKYANSGIPNVRSIDNNVSASEKWKSFYTIVPEHEVERKYPLTEASVSHVAIFTRYLPPESV